jgi:hypothetical protein
VRRWRQRQDVDDQHTAPKTVHKVLRLEQSLLINWLRQKLQVPLDELVILVSQGLGLTVSRAGLDRYLRRLEQPHMYVFQAQDLRGKKAVKAGLPRGKLRLFYQRINLLPDDGGEFHVLWAQEAVSGWIAAQAFAGASAMLVVHWLESLQPKLPAAIECIETENKKLFGNDSSPDHPLQQWCTGKGIALTLHEQTDSDITLRLNMPLSLLLPAAKGHELNGVLQQFCHSYNQLWPQKKLNDSVPEAFWLVQA